MLENGRAYTIVPSKHISADVVNELRSILFEQEQSAEACIRCSRPLTIAYNLAFSLLEEYFIPDFCHGLYIDEANLSCGNSAHEYLGPRDANSVGKHIVRSSSSLSGN